MEATTNGVTKDERLQEQIDVFKQLEGSKSFNRVCEGVYPVFVSDDKLVCELLVQAHHLNSKGTLHGGQTATLTDVVTARALGVTIKNQGMASVELAVSYLLPVKIGDTLEITANVLKVGRTLAFTDCEFRRKSDGKLTAKGKHTVAMLPNQPGVSVENGKQF